MPIKEEKRRHILPSSGGLPPWRLWAIFFTDNDLAEPAKEDLRAIHYTGTPAGVFLAAQTDTLMQIPGQRVTIYNTTQHMVYTEHDPPENGEEPLRDFLCWANGQRPSHGKEKEGKEWSPCTLLVIRGHGDGSGLERNDDRYFHLSDVRDQIQEALLAKNGNPPLSILGFDACLMANIEAAFEFRHLAQFLVASQRHEPPEGLPYGHMFRSLNQRPKEMDPQELAEALVASHKEHHESPEKTTLTAIRLDMSCETAADKLHNLGIELLRLIRDEKNLETIWLIRKNIRTFGRGDFVDIVDLTKALKLADLANQQAMEVEKAIGEMVISHSAANDASHGLSIWFPRMSDVYEDSRIGDYTNARRYLKTQFAQGGNAGWAKFLDGYHKALREQADVRKGKEIWEGLPIAVRTMVSKEGPTPGA